MDQTLLTSMPHLLLPFTTPRPRKRLVSADFSVETDAHAMRTTLCFFESKLFKYGTFTNGDFSLDTMPSSVGSDILFNGTCYEFLIFSFSRH